MSYETSPTEAWIGARRMAVALPVVLSAPEPLQKKILEEFRYLIEQGFIELPALAYWKTAGPARLLLENEINKLDRRDRQAFSEVLDKFRQ
ncbi:MAG: hypothetical protein KGK16_08265, partial [Bradyrhizobium sp.]|nr:hypothetical protein [Bradyrhizobium sp.]